MAIIGDFVSGQNNVSYTRMRQLLEDTALQEGVVGSGDFKVTQNTGSNMQANVAAGFAWIAVDTGTRNGLSHAVSDATATLTVTGSNGTNPRVDQVILRYNDTQVPTGAGNIPTLEVLAGTATAGATLDNRTNAAALPADAIRLADILVPAASTAVTNANIRDRRPWARGARWSANYTAGSFAPGATFGTIAAAFGPRIECAGGEMMLTCGLTYNAAATARVLSVRVTVDGTAVAQRDMTAPVSGYASINLNEPYTPAAGSHVFAFQVTTASTDGTILATATQPITASITETARPNANNT